MPFSDRVKRIFHNFEDNAHTSNVHFVEDTVEERDEEVTSSRASRRNPMQSREVRPISFHSSSPNIASDSKDGVSWKKRMHRRSLDPTTLQQQKKLPPTPRESPKVKTKSPQDAKQTTAYPSQDVSDENSSTRPPQRDLRYVRPTVPPKDPYPTPEPAHEHRDGPRPNAEYFNTKELPVRSRRAPAEPRRINEPAPLGPRKMPPQSGGRDSWARNVSMRDDQKVSSAGKFGNVRNMPLESRKIGRHWNVETANRDFDRRTEQANANDVNPEYGNRVSPLRSQAPVGALDGVVDLRDTIDTTATSHVAPPVTHEHVQQKTINVKHERIVRHIHQDSIYHRVLPIVDVEVTPARHFVPSADSKELVEIFPDDVPEGRLHENMLPRNWTIVENVSRPGNAAMQPRGFSAKDFPGDEGDEKEYRTEEGHLKRETTWVHPPQLEERTEHTKPFYFDHATGYSGWHAPDKSKPVKS